MSIIQHFLLSCLCLLDCLHLGRGNTAGEKRGRRRGKRRIRRLGCRQSLTRLPFFRWRVIGSVSSVCGLCCCQESIEEERGRIDVGLKVERFRRVKRSRVSPGSLCRSLVPADRSCLSSSLSAGCTAARWCLRWREENVVNVRQKG